MRLRRRIPLRRIPLPLLAWIVEHVPAEIARRQKERVEARLTIRSLRRAESQFRSAAALGGGTNEDLIQERLGAGERADAQLRDTMDQAGCRGSTASAAIRCALPAVGGRRSWERADLPLLQEGIDPRLALPGWVDDVLATLEQLELEV